MSWIMQSIHTEYQRTVNQVRSKQMSSIDFDTNSVQNRAPFTDMA